MVSSPWISLVRATLEAAWAASLAGAISFAALLEIANLAAGAYATVGGRAHALDLGSGAIMFMLSLAFSFIITFPVSTVIAACAYPFLATLRVADRRRVGAIGFLLGVLIWPGVWWGALAENGYFGFWISSLVIGGLAGCVGALAFARHLSDNAAN